MLGFRVQGFRVLGLGSRGLGFRAEPKAILTMAAMLGSTVVRIYAPGCGEELRMRVQGVAGFNAVPSGFLGFTGVTRIIWGRA